MITLQGKSCHHVQMRKRAQALNKCLAPDLSAHQWQSCLMVSFYPVTLVPGVFRPLVILLSQGSKGQGFARDGQAKSLNPDSLPAKAPVGSWGAVMAC